MRKEEKNHHYHKMGLMLKISNKVKIKCKLGMKSDIDLLDHITTISFIEEIIFILRIRKLEIRIKEKLNYEFK